MDEMLQRFWEDLSARPSGPLALRFLLQPTVAVMLAVLDGIKDARTGRSPYFWTVLTSGQERGQALRDGFTATGKVMLAAFILDCGYQIANLGSLYLGEAIVVALLLGFVPYLLVRGPVARIARWRTRRSAKPVG